MVACTIFERRSKLPRHYSTSLNIICYLGSSALISLVYKALYLPNEHMDPPDSTRRAEFIYTVRVTMWIYQRRLAMLDDEVVPVVMIFGFETLFGGSGCL